jgi:hypothetical protein
MTKLKTSESRKATLTVGLRLTPVEHAMVLQAAEAAGVGPSTYAREAVLAQANLPLPPRRQQRDGLRVALGPWTRETSKLGNNLNQLARHAHQGGRVDAQALADLTAAVRALHAAVLQAAETGAEEAA